MLLFSHAFLINSVPWQRVMPVAGRMVQAPATRDFERDIGILARYAMGPRAPFDQALDVRLRFLLKQPTRFRMRPFPDVGYDIDNLCKSVLDGCNGIVWRDDCRIIRLTTSKDWTPYRGGEIHLEVHTV